MLGKSSALLVLVPLLLCAQSAWDNLRNLQAGRKVEVRQTSGKKISGRFESASDVAITVQVGRETRSIPREQVASLSLVIGKSRGTKAAIAGGVTGGVLATMVGISCAANNGCEDGMEYVIIGIPMYSGVAAGIAALFPPHREVVYSAQPGVK
jgi:hypothetical protein